MATPTKHASPATELIARVMRIVRTCPEAADDVLELVLLTSQVEALTNVDRGYRDARRVIARLRHPLWDMRPDQRETLSRAAETIRSACGLENAQIPEDPLADTGERERIEDGLFAALRDDFSPVQIARITGAVMAILMA